MDAYDSSNMISLENATNWTIIMNTPDSFTQQICHWKNGQLGKVVLLCNWDCVCDNHLLKQATWQPFNCRRAVEKNVTIEESYDWDGYTQIHHLLNLNWRSSNKMFNISIISNYSVDHCWYFSDFDKKE